MRDGLANVDQLLSRRKRKRPRRGGADRGRSADRRDPGDGRRPLLQPVAVQPRRGRRAGSRDRCSSRSSTWRRSSRPPTAGRTDVTPASIVDDSPTTWEFDDQVWTPENYEQDYDGPITFRRALAHSRNIATIHVAEAAGYDRVAALWKQARRRHHAEGAIRRSRSACSRRRRTRSPTAYTIFPNMGIDAAAAAHRCASSAAART